jgi:predicted helicase
MTPFQKILEHYRKFSFSEADKGNRFERLMQAYLLTDPKYALRFNKVWLWKEFPGKLDFGGHDIGIDLVARTTDGEYWAIQCKCFHETTVIDKPAVDSFLAASGKSFLNEQMKTTLFSQRVWISTTNRWGPNATEAILNQHPPVIRINLFDLVEAPVDWEKLEAGIHGETARTPKKSLYPHQKTALDKAYEYFKENDRGKLIMACGTGKTFTSLRIAEHETDNKGLILFLLPSIALVGQTLREWSADAMEPINAIAICSDPKVSQQKQKNSETDSFSLVDLAYPASTDTDFILQQFQYIKQNRPHGMTVVFSTYQSIEVIAKAQKILLKEGFPEFDLIICDEAHRTTGVSLNGEDESDFIKVHDGDFLKAKKRLYMTATPRLYDDNAKSKAAEADATLCSMDDEALYGKEIYRIGFGEAVERGLLTDYKVLILTLNDKDIPQGVLEMFIKDQKEIDTDDISKIIGTVNALSKQFIGDDELTKKTDPAPMKRAVAFCSNIETSKTISSIYNSVSESYIDQLPLDEQSNMVSPVAKHMDGTMTAPMRDQLLGWLKEETTNNECRILTNVRVLSEGVDVPSLDAVLFLSARNSQVDVVQSVGRVMRKSPGKKYGYIVIPVVVPADVDANEALDDNKRYKVVWTVLNALRAHDDRFNATINKLDLNRKKPNNILIGRPTYGFDEDSNPIPVQESSEKYKKGSNLANQLALQFEQLQEVVYARMVEKVGSRRYWEQWAKDVSIIAERQIERITYLVENRKEQRKAFDKFLLGLQRNINPSTSERQAIEMLAQHIITKPIFEALFEDYSFEKNNPISEAMQKMLNHLEGESVADESEKLQRFYESVRKRVEGIDNAQGKQRIIIELYDKFFKNAFPKMAEQLGIVYTPVEIVDFIIHSVNDVLKKEFDRYISDENIHVLDPFTGTGTFITRLLQSGLLKDTDLKRKYKQELHANEIVLLAYYIATVNIENAYHDLIPKTGDNIKDQNYVPFEGIVLTDTFQLGETDENEELFSETFPQNSARATRQKKTPVRVIIGNPPYSIGQKSANDNAQNQSYPNLEKRIENTYAASSTAGLNKSLYDAYIKAFRWSTDRIKSDHGGIIAFVTNGSWIDGNSTDGFRKTIEKEFSSIWVFNLRGNQRTSGELSRREGGKIFGSGSRAPIAITFLVKNPDAKNKKATIHYHDIGDYLSREEKLKIITEFGSVRNPKMTWKTIEPNEHGDWINHRNDAFDSFIPLAPDKKFDSHSKSFFIAQSLGTATNRDAWVYNFSKSSLQENIRKTINHYNKQLQLFKENKFSQPQRNPNFGNWTRDWMNQLKRGNSISEIDAEYRNSLYRPFTKVNSYFDDDLNQERYQLPKLFPLFNSKNKVISLTGIGVQKTFSVLMADAITDLQFIANGQVFPLYFYEENNNQQKSLFDDPNESEYIRRDGVSDFILNLAQKQYVKNVTKEDIFYYVYGFLHSLDYRTTFANDLKKMLPRIPLVDDVRDFWKFSKAGRKLAELHVEYESVPPFPGVIVKGEDSGYFIVQKMRFPKKGQKDTIIFNNKITISNIPDKAYEYVVNGKSAIEWIIERYQITVDKKSKIKNDPNDWADEVGNPRYILDLLLSVINVSVQTVDIVNQLPKLDFTS